MKEIKQKVIERCKKREIELKLFGLLSRLRGARLLSIVVSKAETKTNLQYRHARMPYHTSTLGDTRAETSFNSRSCICKILNLTQVPTFRHDYVHC
jgi:hypothetical protein